MPAIVRIRTRGFCRAALKQSRYKLTTSCCKPDLLIAPAMLVLTKVKDPGVAGLEIWHFEFFTFFAGAVPSIQMHSL